MDNMLKFIKIYERIIKDDAEGKKIEMNIDEVSTIMALALDMMKSMEKENNDLRYLIKKVSGNSIHSDEQIEKMLQILREETEDGSK